MLAPDGRCKTLDANGDGYVRGETCVTLLLEDLELAERTAAILKGSAVNQACPYFFRTYILRDPSDKVTLSLIEL